MQYLLLLTIISYIYSVNTYQPVIGILSQPTNGLNEEVYPPSKYQYVASSYVKWVQASGARPLIIPYDLTEQEMDFYFQHINGLLFPGGDASLWENEETHSGLSQYTLVGQKLINKVIQLNKNGTYFPLLGTCLGYELIVLAITNQDKALGFLNSKNHVLNTNVFMQRSKMYSTFSRKTIQAIQEQSTLYYNHRFGLPIDMYYNNTILEKFFVLTAYAKDNNGTKFVASIEGKNYPIFGNQFHPEKNSYEWLESTNANHSEEAVKVAQQIGNWFVDQARRNNNTFEQKEFIKYSIENNNLVGIYKPFVSVYIIKNKNFTESAQY